MKKEVKLKEAILHILDSNVSMPVLSASTIEITEEIEIFLEKHLQKILEDGNIQESVFLSESRMQKCIEAYQNKSSDLIETSHFVARFLFDILQKNVEIPPADLVVCVFEYSSTDYLGILKMNYKTGYSHYVSQTDAGVYNMLVKQKALLPQETQKVTECAIISMSDLKIQIIQKEYEVNGTKVDYWSKLFLQCTSQLSSNSKLNILEKSAQKVAKKYFEEDFTKVAHARKVVAETLEETSVIHLDELANEVFEKNEDIKKEYIQELHIAGIRDISISVDNDTVSRKIKNQKIKTDTGIEINFPSSFFNDKDKIEFVNNIDGTISILIKNVSKIQNR